MLWILASAGMTLLVMRYSLPVYKRDYGKYLPRDAGSVRMMSL